MKVHTMLRFSFASAFIAGALMATSVYAQQGRMTLDELEKLVQDQRIELEAVIAEREKNQAKIDDLEVALEELDSRGGLLQSEVESLCQEHDDAKPGTFDVCMDQFGS